MSDKHVFWNYIAFKCNTNITNCVWLCDAMTKDFVGKKWVSLLRCLEVSIMMKSVLLALSRGLLFVTQPEISLRQSPSCLRERSVSVVDKDVYTWVSSAYNWMSNSWLWIRELNGVVYRVNSSGSRTEPWKTP